jgi:hypothetical protein
MLGSINIPFLDVIDKSTHKLLNDTQLRQIFKDIRLDESIILSCGSGVTACILYTALERIGAIYLSVVRLHLLVVILVRWKLDRVRYQEQRELYSIKNQL